MNNIDVLKNNFLNKEKYLSKYATLSSSAIRYSDTILSDDIRPPYFHELLMFN